MNDTSLGCWYQFMRLRTVEDDVFPKCLLQFELNRTKNFMFISLQNGIFQLIRLKKEIDSLGNISSNLFMVE